jgi:hypothetical protein
MTCAIVRKASALALVLPLTLMFAMSPALAEPDDPAPAAPAAQAEPKPFCTIVEPAQPRPQTEPAPAAAQTAEPPKDGAAQPAPTPDIVLREQLQATCGDGKINFSVSVLSQPHAGRLYGWKIGDVIPLRLQFEVGKNAAINLDPLMQGKLAITEGFKQPFEMVGKPVLRRVVNGDVTTYDITIEVRQFEPIPYVRFSLELPYATTFAPDKTPQWQAFSTPAYVLLNNIDGGYEVKRPMTPGNAFPMVPRAPWVVPFGTVVVVLLFLSWPAVLLMRYINRVRPRKHISREAAAWLAMHRVMKSGHEIGFGAPHYSRISEVLRKYFSPTYPGLEGMTLTEINALPEDPQASTIKSAFRKLDRALFGNTPLTPAEVGELVKEVDALIKRPWTM